MLYDDGVFVGSRESSPLVHCYSVLKSDSRNCQIHFTDSRLSLPYIPIKRFFQEILSQQWAENENPEI